MARTKVISAKEAAALIKDGDTVLVGGFMTNGTAKSIVNEVTAKDLTVVCNDAGFENEGTGRSHRRRQYRSGTYPSYQRKN